MRQVARTIDAFNTGIGKAVAWFALLMVLVQFGVVLGRYVYGVGAIAAQESIVYMHGFLFMLAAAYTLRIDGHVRVDIFYREASARTKALVNLIGAVVLLIPVCVLIVWVAWPYVAQSWSVFEGSKETSGIKGVYLLKGAIIAFAVQMALQGVSIVMHSLLALAGDPDEVAALGRPGVAP